MLSGKILISPRLFHCCIAVLNWLEYFVLPPHLISSPSTELRPEAHAPGTATNSTPITTETVNNTNTKIIPNLILFFINYASSSYVLN